MASDGVAGGDRVCCYVQGEKGEHGDKGSPGESVGHPFHFPFVALAVREG